MQKNIFIKIFLLFCIALKADPVDELQTLIKKTEPKTLDALIKNLPKKALSSYTLMHSSKSSQESSETFPRVIAYGEDASIIYAFNGHPKHAGYSSLEIGRVLPNGNLELRNVVQTNGENQSLKLSEANPATCLKCHGNPPRWIWNEYHNWPGAYGNIGGKDYKEVTSFKKSGDFLKHERYKNLEGLLPLDSMYFGGALKRSNHETQDPNSILGWLISQRFAKMQFNRFWSSAAAKEFKYSLAALLYDCKLSEMEREKLIQKLKAEGAKLNAINSEKELILAILSLGDVSLDDIRHAKNETIEKPQVSVLDFFDGNGSGRYSKDYLLFFLAERLSEEQAALKKWIPKPYGNYKTEGDKRYYGASEKIALQFHRPVSVSQQKEELDQINSICAIFTNNLFTKGETKRNGDALPAMKH